MVTSQQPSGVQPGRATRVAFWIFYLLIGFWIDMFFTDLWWGLGIGLGAALPVYLMQRTGILNTNLVVATDFGNRWVQLGVVGLVSLSGVLLLASAVRYWWPAHRWFFRRFGGAGVR